MSYVEGVHNSISSSVVSKLICGVLDVSVDELMLAGVEGVHTISSDSGEQEVVFLLLWPRVDSELAIASRLICNNKRNSLTEILSLINHHKICHPAMYKLHTHITSGKGKTTNC